MFAQRMATAVALSVALMGCQTEPSGSGNTPVTNAAGPAVAVIGFRCPANGTIVHLNTGGRFHHRGSDSIDPSTCTLTSANGTQVRRLFDLVSLPNENEATYRRSMSALWPLEVGKTANFIVSGRNHQTRESWRVLRREALGLRSGSRDTFVLEQTFQGMFGDTSVVTFTIWVDVQTGAQLKRDMRIVQGSGPGFAPYEAVRIEIP